MSKVTYKKSGVDLRAMGLFKEDIKPLARKSFRPEVLRDIGGFGSFFALQKDKYKNPVLVSSSDGVGTKLKIASIVDRNASVGIDAVAMNVNDILCAGAEPLFFLDYISFSKLRQETLVDIIKGINQGCIQANCSLIGGETAQMPDMYKEGEYDLAGFCVGVVEKNEIIDGSKIEAGDIVIGLESNGLHSNGYSLVRKVFSQNELKRLASELLKPTRIYVKPVLSLLRELPRLRSGQARTEHRAPIKGIAHITGGAFYDKITRILPVNTGVKLNKNSWPVPKIFRLIQNKGAIEDKEMYHTFNMGVGMVLMVSPKLAKEVILQLSKFNLKSWIIGTTVKGNKEVHIV